MPVALVHDPGHVRPVITGAGAWDVGRRRSNGLAVTQPG